MGKGCGATEIANGSGPRRAPRSAAPSAWMEMARRRVKQSAPQSAPVENGSAEERIVLFVPSQLGDLARKCQESYRAPIEIQSYKRFGKTLAMRIKADPVICVADLDAYAEVVNGEGEKDPAAVERAGKVLLLANGSEDSRIAVNDLRGVDLLADDASASVWTFTVNKAIAEIEQDREIATLREGNVKKSRDLDSLNEIGMALSTEKDLDSLLEMIVTNCREMTYADGGSLYMIESFLVDIKPSSIYGYVAMNQESLNLRDAYVIDADSGYGWGGREFDAAIGYRTMSMLTVPMVNWRGETIGVIQLINRKVDPELVLGDPETCVEHILPFTEHDERMAMSIASQASIAIQNAQLVEDIQNLFNGFIKASVKAIESRDPTTSGHSTRVAELTVALAEKVSETNVKAFRDIHFSEDDVQELRYASLLHDFGKIGVRENVLIKAKKLYPYERQSVLDRFDMIRRTAQADALRLQVERLLKESKDKAMIIVERARDDLDARIAELEQYLEFILKCNEPTVLAQGGFEQLTEIAAKSYRSWDGTEVPFLSEKELISLSVPKGSLNENDRKEIESHVTHTYKFLSEIPWTKDLRRVPEIAYAHHEKLDGTGYPNRLTGDEIPIQAKMMTISDIFDALTAWDRPYKKAVPLERALNILVEEANASHVDKALLDVFIGAELYKIVEVRD